MVFGWPRRKSPPTGDELVPEQLGDPAPEAASPEPEPPSKEPTCPTSPDPERSREPSAPPVAAGQPPPAGPPRQPPPRKRSAGNPPPAPPNQPPSGPYSADHPDEHLFEELRRIDLLVRAHVIVWRLTIGASKPASQWGMLTVSDAELEAYVGHQFRFPGSWPDRERPAVRDLRRQAAAQRDAIDARLAQTPPAVRNRLPLVRLREACRLTLVAQDLVLAGLLPQWDDRYRRLYAYLMDDAARIAPTLGLLADLILADEPNADLQAITAPLLTGQILAWSGDDHTSLPWRCRSVRVEDRISGFLLRSSRPDPRLDGVLDPVPSARFDELLLEPGLVAQLRRLANWWSALPPAAPSNDPQDRATAAPHARGLLLLLTGEHGSGRRSAAAAFSGAVGRPLWQVDVTAALRSSLDWPSLVRACYREAILAGADLLWCNAERLREDEQAEHRWETLVTAADAHSGVTCIASTSAWEPNGRFRALRLLRLEFPPPGIELRARIWDHELPGPERFASPAPLRQDMIHVLAGSFQLNAGQIRDAIRTAGRRALLRSPEKPQLTLSDLQDGCRRQSGERLRTLAACVEPPRDSADRNLDRIVLPPAARKRLQDLSDRIRYRNQVHAEVGLDRQGTIGLVALFAGPSGTGKTLASESLAAIHGLDLYKIDLSAVVSKYVGETEKNLARVFAEAQGSNAVILFDEADALFSRRGEIREARDRWANLETNYLLQRIETYPGVVILATNLRKNIDDAFQRRIHVLVEFPLPDAPARAELLRRMLPADFGVLPDREIKLFAERFQLSGGGIRNVVVDAVFRAVARAAEPHPHHPEPARDSGAPHAASGERPLIRLSDLVIAVGHEYEKLGRPITESEFGALFFGWWQQDLASPSRRAAS